jgi:catechol O-methyltransferase
MRAQEGKAWRSVEHDTHAEYQTPWKDIVLESEYVGAQGRARWPLRVSREI